MALNGVNNISSINTVLPPSYETGKVTGDSNNAVSFGDYLNEALNKVNDMQVEAENISDAFAAGKTDNIHQVMIAAEKADLALQFTMQVRNKLLDAYNEIMRMQI